MTEFDDGRYWPVVADFFVTVLAIFVLIHAGSQQKDPALVAKIVSIREELTRNQNARLIREFQANDREVNIVYSDQDLGFPDCGWTIASDTAQQIRHHMELFLAIEDYINLLQIEGHADIRRPRGCESLKFKTNFELSETRAMSVFAALLGRSIEDLDEAVADLAGNGQPGLVGRLASRQKVLVAGFGSTRPVAGAPPTDRRHRRVEVRLTFNERPVTGKAALVAR